MSRKGKDATKITESFHHEPNIETSRPSLFSAFKAMCFLIGAILMYPVYIVTESGYNISQINKGVSFFMAASWFFVLHSVCFTVAVYQYSKMQPATEKEVPRNEELKEAPVEEPVQESA